MSTCSIGALSVPQAAQYLSVSIPALRKWISKGQIPVVRAGRRVLLSRAEIDARLASGQLLDEPQKQ